MKPKTMTIKEVCEMFGVQGPVISNRVKRAKLCPLAHGVYARDELLKIASKQVRKRQPARDQNYSGPPNQNYSGPPTVSMTAAAKENGIHWHTVSQWIKRAGLTPVNGRKYEREAIIRLIRNPPPRRNPGLGKAAGKIGINDRSACSRCGDYDSGNEVRGGLCLDCWCHDYCVAKGL